MTTLFTALSIIVTVLILGIFYITWKILRLLTKTNSKESYEQIKKASNRTNENLERIHIFLQEQSENTQGNSITPISKPSIQTPPSLRSKSPSMENVKISDVALEKLIKAYETVSSGRMFVPVSQVIQALVQNKFVKTKESAEQLISELFFRYPRVVRIEDVRGSNEKHIAIYKEMIQ